MTNQYSKLIGLDKSVLDWKNHPIDILPNWLVYWQGSLHYFTIFELEFLLNPF